MRTESNDPAEVSLEINATSNTKPENTDDEKLLAERLLWP
jgi:hypothetical protein